MAANDPEGFRALYEAHHRAVCRYLSVRVAPGVVEDVAADTFPRGHGDALRRLDRIVQDAQRRALLQALGELSDAGRELLLRHWDALAPREVAVAIGQRPVVARARLHRAQRRLVRAHRRRSAVAQGRVIEPARRGG